MKPGLSLYYSSYCYFCHKVLGFMNSNGIEIELKNTSDRENASALMQGGGKTQVPCLRIESDSGVRWLYESNDIIAYLGQA